MVRWRTALSLSLPVVIWIGVVASGRVPDSYFPGPLTTAEAMVNGFLSGEFPRAMAETVLRALSGLAAATALAIAVALLSARYDILRRAISPIAEFFRPLPPSSLVPMSIFFLGLGWQLHGFILVFACVWPIYLNASAALQAVPLTLMRTAASFGYQGWERVLLVQLPSALPEIFIGLRIAGSVALIVAVVTEMLVGRDGLGYLLVDAAGTLRVPDVFAGLVLSAVCGFAINLSVNVARKGVIGWHVRMTAGNQA